MLVQSMPYPASGGASITLGPSGAGVSDSGYVGGWMQGRAHQAASNGTLNFLNIRGSAVSATAVDYRLVVYAATAANVWGAKLGETAVVNGLAINQVKSIPLIAPVSVVSGNYYAICVHPAGTIEVRNAVSSGSGYYYVDAYADGAAATASATSLFGPSPCVWGTTV